MYFIFCSLFKCPYIQSYFILLYAFTFCVPCCDVPYGFRKRTMFGSPLPPVVLGGLMSYLFYLCLFAHSRVQHVFNIWITWRCLIRDRNCLPLASTWVHRRYFVSSCYSSFFSFLSCVVFLFWLSSSCVLCTQCYRCPWTVHSSLPLRFLSRLFIATSSYTFWYSILNLILFVKVITISV